MGRTKHRLPLTILAGAVLLIAPALEAGTASRTRRTTARAGSRPAAARTAVRQGGTTVRAAGRATYGYYRGRHHGYRYYPYGYRGHLSVGYYPGYPGWWWPYGYYAHWGYYGSPPRYYPEARATADAPAALETGVRPKKAAVRVDGEEVGQARDYNGRWDVLWLEPGTHIVEFEYPDHMLLRIELRTRAGAHYRIDHRLRPGEGLDPRSSTVEALAGEGEEGERASTRGGVGNSSVESARPGGGSLSKGFLRFHVLPADAAIYLDGEFLASAAELARLHGAIPVAAGEHRLEIVRPGFRSHVSSVIVERGESTALEVSLKRGGAP